MQTRTPRRIRMLEPHEDLAQVGPDEDELRFPPPWSEHSAPAPARAAGAVLLSVLLLLAALSVGGRLESELTDWGTDGDDNLPEDVFLELGGQGTTYGAQASFVCTQYECVSEE
jgi:hypothetical protein